MEGRAGGRLLPALLLALLALGTLPYAHSLDVPFYFDDATSITDNAPIRVTRWTSEAVSRVVFESVLPRRPVANLSFALNYYLGGYEVAGYHAFNLAVHGAAGLAVFVLSAQLFGLAWPHTPSRRRLWLSALAAGVFVAHPVQTQAVTYVVQRMTTLAALFSLLSLSLFVAGRVDRRRRGPLWLGAGALWLLAMGSKEIAVVVPVLAFGIEWAFFRGWSGRWLLRVSPWLALGAVLSAGVAALYLGGSPIDRIAGGYRVRDFTMGERLLTQPRVVVFYISLLLLPHPARQSLIHDFPASQSLLDPPTTLLSCLALAALLALGGWLARREPMAAFGIFFFAAALVLESSVVALEMSFEHRLYLPLAGFAWLAASAWRRLAAPWPRAALVSGVSAVLVLAVAAGARNQVWRDPVTLWTSVLAGNPRSFRAHGGLCAALIRGGEPGAAIEPCRAAVELRPEQPLVKEKVRRVQESGVLTNLALALDRTGQREEAAELYRRAIEVEPENSAARFNLAGILEARGEHEEAEHHYRSAVAAHPGLTGAHMRLGRLALQRKSHREALEHFRAAVESDPLSADAHNSLGVMLEHHGDPAAEHHYREATRLAPDYVRAYLNLAMVLARDGRIAEAESVFREVLRIEPGNRMARRQLRRLGSPAQRPPPGPE